MSLAIRSHLLCVRGYTSTERHAWPSTECTSFFCFKLNFTFVLFTGRLRLLRFHEVLKLRRVPYVLPGTFVKNTKLVEVPMCTRLYVCDACKERFTDLIEMRNQGVPFHLGPETSCQWLEWLEDP